MRTYWTNPSTFSNTNRNTYYSVSFGKTYNSFSYRKPDDSANIVAINCTDNTPIVLTVNCTSNLGTIHTSNSNTNCTPNSRAYSGSIQQPYMDTVFGLFRQRIYGYFR